MNISNQSISPRCAFCLHQSFMSRRPKSQSFRAKFLPAPEQDEEYQVSKRHLSEQFFNMQISLPPARGLNDARPTTRGLADEGGSGDEFGKQGFKRHQTSPDTNMKPW